MSPAPYSYRSDASVPRFPDDRPIVIFDGKCVLCCTFARFILRTDRRKRLRLMAAQTPLGTALYRHYGLDHVNYGTYVLLAEGRAWFKSTASIRIFALLGSPWSLLSVFWLVPGALRDRLYDVVAQNRLRWFGVRNSCYLPGPDQADRFLG
jgi:predicted DCC family thiol-disulfide oxidoreductase YuxK